jgi:hypothetical protein
VEMRSVETPDCEAVDGFDPVGGSGRIGGTGDASLESGIETGTVELYT